MNRNALSVGLSLILGMASVTLHAATLRNGEDVLLIDPGVASGTGATSNVATGSWFAMDQNNDGLIQNSERTSINPGLQGGIIIGILQAHGSTSTTGQLTGPGQIDTWSYYGVNGDDYTPSHAVTGGTTSGLDMSGWTMDWFEPAISLGSGAWQPLNCSALGCAGHTFTNSNAEFTWDGVYGDVYTLNYAATVPASDPGAHGEKYYLHLEGCVGPIPVPLPAALWLLASGLLGFVGIAKRRHQDMTTPLRSLMR